MVAEISDRIQGARGGGSVRRTRGSDTDELCM